MTEQRRDGREGVGLGNHPVCALRHGVPHGTTQPEKEAPWRPASEPRWRPRWHRRPRGGFRSHACGRSSAPARSGTTATSRSWSRGSAGHRGPGMAPARRGRGALGARPGHRLRRGVVIPVAIALLLAALLAPAVQGCVRHVPRGLATAMVLVGGLAASAACSPSSCAPFVGGVPQLGAQPGRRASTSCRRLAGERAAARQRGTAAGRPGAVLRHVQREPGGDHRGHADDGGHGRRGAHRVPARRVHADLLPARRRRDLAVPAQGRARRVRTRVDVAGRRGLAALVQLRAGDGRGGRRRRHRRSGSALAILQVSRWPCRWPPWSSSARSSRSSARSSPGAAAVLVALVAQGPITALIVLAVIIGVMQLESHVLQPLLLGRAVKLHPLAVVLSIAHRAGRRADRGRAAGRAAAGGAQLGHPVAAQRGRRARRPGGRAHQRAGGDRARTSPGLDRQPGLTS